MGSTMFETNLYRIQHQKLLSMLEELRTLLDVSTLATNASRARSLLSQLASALSVHLYLEDTELYPQILNNRDPAIRGKAGAYKDEMGDLMVVFKAYLGSYHSTEQIQAAPVAFVEDTQGIFQALLKRITAEEADLFVMLESVE